MSVLLSVGGLACSDEAAQQAQRDQAVKQAEDDPWLDAIEDEEPAPVADSAPPTASPAPDALDAAPLGSDPAAPAAPAADPNAPALEPSAAAAPSDDAPGHAAATPSKHESGHASGDASGSGALAQGSPAAEASSEAPADPNGEADPEALPAPALAPAPTPAPAPAPAEPPPITLADFNGSYRFAGGSTQRQALTAAIEEAAMGLPGIIRGIGRKRLTKTNPIDDYLSISISGDQVTTTFASGFNPTATLDAGQVTWTSKKSGDKYRVRVKQKGNKLIQVIAGDDGVKTTVFVLSSDRSRLTVHHKITADRLPEPMTYKFTYARK